MIVWLAALFCTAVVSWAAGYQRGQRDAAAAYIRAAIGRLQAKPKPTPNRLTADAIATALETSRNATVYHDTSSTGPLVATWTLERRH